MKIGMVGLGKMGANMTRRLIEKGHEVVGFDLGAEARAAVAAYGADTASSLEELAAKLSAAPGGLGDGAGRRADRGHHHRARPAVRGRATWSSTAATPTTKRPPRCVEGLAANGASHFVDAGTSGGVWGLKNGYCIMVGRQPRRRWRCAEPVFLAARARGRLRPRRAARRRALRQDGPQRHRVRPHAGLRRGIRDHVQGARVRPRPARDRLHLALRLGGALLAARAGRAGPAARVRASTRSRRWWSTPARAGGRSRRRSSAGCRSR